LEAERLKQSEKERKKQSDTKKKERKKAEAAELKAKKDREKLEKKLEKEMRTQKEDSVEENGAILSRAAFGTIPQAPPLEGLSQRMTNKKKWFKRLHFPSIQKKNAKTTEQQVVENEGKASTSTCSTDLSTSTKRKRWFSSKGKSSSNLNSSTSRSTSAAATYDEAQKATAEQSTSHSQNDILLSALPVNQRASIRELVPLSTFQEQDLAPGIALSCVLKNIEEASKNTSEDSSAIIDDLSSGSSTSLERETSFGDLPRQMKKKIPKLTKQLIKGMGLDNIKEEEIAQSVCAFFMPMTSTILDVSNLFAFCGPVEHIFMEKNPNRDTKFAIIVFSYPASAILSLSLSNHVVVHDEQQFMIQVCLYSKLMAFSFGKTLMSQMFKMNLWRSRENLSSQLTSDRDATMVIRALIQKGYIPKHDAKKAVEDSVMYNDRVTIFNKKKLKEDEKNEERHLVMKAIKKREKKMRKMMQSATLQQSNVSGFEFQHLIEEEAQKLIEGERNGEVLGSPQEGEGVHDYAQDSRTSAVAIEDESNVIR